MHIFPDLKRLEGKFARELAVVGVHSGKFPGEQVTEHIEAAARRYGLHHAIVNDADSVIWKRYRVRAWPTVIILDTRGRQVGQVIGEGHGRTLDRVIGQLIAEGERNKTLDRSELDFLKKPESKKRPLHFPGKILADPLGGRLFVADSNNHRVLEVAPDGKVTRVIGSGKAGIETGSALSG